MSKLIDDKELIERILDKLDAFTNELTQLKLVSIKQESNLREHMKRSDALEKQISNLQIEIAPIKKHVNYVEVTLKLIGLFSVLVGVLVGLFELKEAIFK